MNGLAPLSYPAIGWWAHLKGILIEPHEIDALLLLDGIMLNPSRPNPPTPQTPDTPVPVRAWPSRNADA